MRKRIYLLFVAMLSCFAAWAQVPSETDLTAAGYDINNNVVLCFHFVPKVSCADIVLTGSFNDWAEIPAECPKFDKLTGFDGWYVVSLPFEDNLNAKPVVLNEDGTFDWNKQAGDPGAWLHVDGKQARIEDGFDGESNVYYESKGAFIYDIQYLKYGNIACLPDPLTEVKATVLVPSDCGMDVSNGLYICWWSSENSSDRHIEQMLSEEGRKYTITFNPNYYSYGYYFQNAATLTDDTHTTYMQSDMTLASACWEIGLLSYSNTVHSLIQDELCTATDHNYLPSNILATPVGRDTVKFTWSETTPSDYSYYIINCYEAGSESPVASVNFYSFDLTSLEYQARLRIPKATTFDYWTLTRYANGYNYTTRGEGFLIDGDERLPYDLTVTDAGENKYTLNWKGNAHHYKLSVDISGDYKNYSTTDNSYSLDVSDNQNVYGNLTAWNEDESESYGSCEFSFNTYKVTPRDISLRFYMPQSLGFETVNGAAVKWKDATFAGEHLVILKSDDEAANWYTATIADYDREAIRMTLLNAQTEEAATEVIEWPNAIRETTEFVARKDDEGKNEILQMTGYDYSYNNKPIYPNDYAAYNLQASQDQNVITFTWEVKDAPQVWYLTLYQDGKYLTRQQMSGNSTSLEWKHNYSTSSIYTWSLLPCPVNYYNSYAELTVNGEPFKAAPSPFLPSNLQAKDNGDGTFTFSWDAAPSEEVAYYRVEIIHPGYVRNDDFNNIEETSITRTFNKVFSGEYYMNVFAYSEAGMSLGSEGIKFNVEPTEWHDINIRVMINPMAGIDTSEGLKFNIWKNASSSENLVDAVKEDYGWWSYKLNTDQYGVRVSLDYNSAMVYGDTCMEFDGRFSPVECDARNTDYQATNIQTKDNGDGTFTFSWEPARSKKIQYYELQVIDPAGQTLVNKYNIYSNSVTEVMQPTLSGDYTVEVRSYADYSLRGRAKDTYTVEPVPARDIHVNILINPMAGIDTSAGLKLMVKKSAEGAKEVDAVKGEHGWWSYTLNTVNPGILVAVKSGYYYYNYASVFGDTCLIFNGDNLSEVNCDAMDTDFQPTDLKALDNGDGTFSFSWTPARSERVKSYELYLYDPAGYSFGYGQNASATGVKVAMKPMYSGNYTFKVWTFDNNKNRIGLAEQTFAVEPVPTRDMTIRVLINPMSGYDTSSGVQFKIAKTISGFETVDATKQNYGWWEYSYKTDQPGARVMLADGYYQMNVYGDTCVEYMNSNFYEADCDQRDTDYQPKNITAIDNNDGTFTISWVMDRTDKVKYYQINVCDETSTTCFNERIEATQFKTGVLALAGNYTCLITVYSEIPNDYGYTDLIQIGQNYGFFTVKPKEAERTVQLRVLQQPGTPAWIGRAWNETERDYESIVFKDEGAGWFSASFKTTQPALPVRLRDEYDALTAMFEIQDELCIELNDGFVKTSCDTKQEDFTLSDLHAEDMGNGRIRFEWACPTDPSYFYITAYRPDSSYLVEWNVSSSARAYDATIMADTVTNIIWSVVPVKRFSNWGNAALFDKTAYGNPLSVAASKYNPQNIVISPAADAKWYITWDEVGAPIQRYIVKVSYPNGNSERRYVDENAYTTNVLSQLGTYYVTVEAIDAQGNKQGQQSASFMVTEVEERDITVRLLLHPDASTTIRNMEYWTKDGYQYVSPKDEGNSWYSYTFKSNMPAVDVEIMWRNATITGDTCFQYVRNLESAECDAEPHDYRLLDGSLKAESQPGMTLFTWAAKEKSDSYELQLRIYVPEEDRYYYDYILVYDTCYTYLVPDKYDGATVTWYVTPINPHYLSSVYAEKTVTLIKSLIVLSDMKTTSDDSVHYTFNWTSNTPNLKYEVMVTSGYSSNYFMRKQVTDTKCTFTCPTGSVTYVWQVRAIDAEGKPLTNWIQSDEFYPKKDLRTVNNFKGALNGKQLTYTWETELPSVYINFYCIIDGSTYVNLKDSVVTDHSFSYTADMDGRYMLILYPIIQMEDDKSFTLYENLTVGINYFSAKTYHVTVAAGEGGYLYEDASGNYPEGYRLRLQADPYEHYMFTGWSDGGEYQYRELVVRSDTNIVANFKRLENYNVSLRTSEGGKLLINDTELVDALDTVIEMYQGLNIEAIPVDGYALYEWSDGMVRTITERYLTVRQDTAITAVFKPLCSVTVQAETGGRVQVSGAEYDKSSKAYICLYGTQITVKADPDEGYRFSQWSDGNFNVNRTIVVTGNMNLSASFELASEPLTKHLVYVISENIEYGTVSQVSGTYNKGDKITITATPSDFTTFAQWSDGDKNATRVITVNSDTTLIAHFQLKQYTLKLLAGEGGKVNSADVDGIYTYGTDVNIIATPDEHYVFSYWSDYSGSANRTVTVTSDLELTAYFELESFNVSFYNADGVLLDSRNWPYGATPALGYQPTLPSTEEFTYIFKGWTPDITPVDGPAVYTAVYDEVPNPTGLEDIPYVEQATKVLINGQLFIIRGDRIYTIQGNLVK